jgi:hypothetical protein
MPVSPYFIGYIGPINPPHAEFICRNPSCNHFNRSARSKREALSTGNSPQSNASPPQPSNQSSPQATPSPLERSSSTLNEPVVHDSDPDAPTVDSIDAGVMEVDS